MKQLFPKQRQAADLLLAALRTHGAALNASVTGTGKTLMSVTMARELDPPGVLVVCPKSVIVPWQRCFEEQGMPVPPVINYEKLKTGGTPWVRKLGKRKFELRFPKGALVIWDESHRLKSWDSQNSAMATASIMQGMKNLFLSATPFRDPTEMKVHGLALKLFGLHGYWEWAAHHGCTKDHWGKLQFDGTDEAARARLSAISREIYADRAVRLTRADLGEHFAQCSIDWSPRDFGDGGRIGRELASVEDALMRLAEKQTLDGLDPATMTKILRARQKVELLKLPGIAEQVKDALEDGMSVFVALCFRDSVEALKGMLGMDVAEIHGGTSAKERQAGSDAFQSDRVRVCIANIAAGGVGVNLHDETGKHPRLALISPSFDEKELSQALGRTDRLGSRSDTVQRIMIAAGTIEEAILNTLLQKLSLFDLTHSAGGSNELPETSIEHETLKPENQLDTAEPTPAHAEFGPSSLKYYASCAGYLPTEGDNEASIRGTRIHLALETDNDSGLQDATDAELASWCRRAVAAIYRREQIVIGDHDLREVRLEIEAFGEKTFGTCDRLAMPWKMDRAVALDYKTGRGAIDAVESNWQAKAYSAGVLLKYPDVREVSFYFVIPRRDEILHGTFRRSDLPQMLTEIAAVIRRARQTRSCAAKGEILIENFKVDTDICQYCARVAKPGGCPKWTGLAVETVRRYDPDMDLPETTNAMLISEPEQIAKLLSIRTILEKVMDGWVAQAKEMMLERGIDVPGYEMKQASGAREITNVLAALDIAEEYGVTTNEFLKAVSGIPVGEWEELIEAKAQKGKKKALKQEALGKLAVAGGITQKEGTWRIMKVRK